VKDHLYLQNDAKKMGEKMFETLLLLKLIRPIGNLVSYILIDYQTVTVIYVHLMVYEKNMDARI